MIQPSRSTPATRAGSTWAEPSTASRLRDRLHPFDRWRPDLLRGGDERLGLHADTHAIAVAPSNPAIVYLGNDGGIFKSIDRGQSWINLNNTQFNATQFYSLATAPGGPGADDRRHAGQRHDPAPGGRHVDPGPRQRRRFHRDRQQRRERRGSRFLRNLFQQGRPRQLPGVFAGLQHRLRGQRQLGVSRLWLHGRDTIRIATASPTSRHNGLHCDDSAVLFFAPMVRGPGRPNTLYFGTDRLYRSTDRGDTMTVVSQQFVVPSAHQNPVAVSAIAIAPERRPRAASGARQRPRSS